MNLTPEQFDLTSKALGWSLLVIALAAPFTFLIKTRKFVASIIWMWASLVLWAVFMCVILPVGLHYLTLDEEAYRHFPKAYGIMAMVIIGWLPSLVICFLIHQTQTLWLERTRLSS